MSEKMTGIVQWYNTNRGFGVILGSDDNEYFVHNSKLPQGLSDLTIGTRLVFEVAPRPPRKKGCEAVHLELDRSPVQKPPQVIKPTPIISQSMQPSPETSGLDYWYQIYSAGAGTNTSSHPVGQLLETKVVGVTYEGRQSIVSLLKVGEEVFLVREPDNPYDNNAIKVIRKNGQDFGFINRHLSARLATEFDKFGQPVKATVTYLTGGYNTNSNFGVTIKFNLPNNDGLFPED